MGGQLRQLFNTHIVAQQLLDSQHEVGSGVFDPFLPDPEHCSASNTTSWELSLLTRHYHPPTARMAVHVSAQCPTSGEHTLSHDFKIPSDQLYEDFSMDDMAFNPIIQPPKKTGKRGKGTPCTDFLTLI